jgi:hypothetical protein
MLFSKSAPAGPVVKGSRIAVVQMPERKLTAYICTAGGHAPVAEHHEKAPGWFTAAVGSLALDHAGDELKAITQRRESLSESGHARGHAFVNDHGDVQFGFETVAGLGMSRFGKLFKHGSLVVAAPGLMVRSISVDGHGEPIEARGGKQSKAISIEK